MRALAPKRTATFGFSSESGATFECQLDKKPASACTSPAKAKKLKPGKHKFTVTAIDAAGNRDPSPLVFKFKVTKP